MAEPIADWNDAYANAPHIPHAESFVPAWHQRAGDFRTEAGSIHSRIAYGPAERQWMDLFHPAGPPAGLAVFVHGGYWMKFDASVWSHLAAGALARGWAVAMPSYTLAPEADVPSITREIADAISVAAAEVAGPVALAGHSAGGHLVSRQVCADSLVSPEIRARIVHVLSISGVHDLRPLLATDLNATLGLDAASAIAESPALLWPETGARVTAWVGAAERPEFCRQSALLANIWTGAGIDVDAIEVPGRHHYDVIDDLQNPEGAMVERWLGGV